MRGGTEPCFVRPDMSRSFVLLAILVNAGSVAVAQQVPEPPAQQTPEPTLEEDLSRSAEPRDASSTAQDAIDPTAPLLQVALRLEWDPSHHGEQGASAVALLFRPSVPFEAWGVPNLLRVVVPYELETREDAQGLGPVEIFDLVTAEVGPGRLGVGPVTSWQPNDGDGDRFHLGPVLGYVARVGEVTLGVLNQNLIGDVDSVSSVQPIAAITLAPWISVGLGELELEWSWDESQWQAIPVGVAIDLIADVAGQFVRFGVNPQYDIHDAAGLFEWRIAAQLGLLAR